MSCKMVGTLLMWIDGEAVQVFHNAENFSICIQQPDIFSLVSQNTEKMFTHKGNFAELFYFYDKLYLPVKFQYMSYPAKQKNLKFQMPLKTKQKRKSVKGFIGSNGTFLRKPRGEKSIKMVPLKGKGHEIRIG